MWCTYHNNASHDMFVTRNMAISGVHNGSDKHATTLAFTRAVFCTVGFAAGSYKLHLEYILSVRTIAC